VRTFQSLFSFIITAGDVDVSSLEVLFLGLNIGTLRNVERLSGQMSLRARGGLWDRHEVFIVVLVAVVHVHDLILCAHVCSGVAQLVLGVQVVAPLLTPS
jgi:hypothetical protein